MLKNCKRTDLERNFSSNLVDDVHTANVQDKNDDFFKVIANVRVGTKELLDHTSKVTGIKKGRIIENGIIAECERLAKIL